MSYYEPGPDSLPLVALDTGGLGLVEFTPLIAAGAAAGIKKLFGGKRRRKPPPAPYVHNWWSPMVADADDQWRQRSIQWSSPSYVRQEADAWTREDVQEMVQAARQRAAAGYLSGPCLPEAPGLGANPFQEAWDKLFRKKKAEEREVRQEKQEQATQARFQDAAALHSETTDSIFKTALVVGGLVVALGAFSRWGR